MSFLDCDLRITQGVSNVSEVLALEIMQPQDFLVLIGQCRPFQQIIKSGYIRDVLELPSGVKMTAQIKHPFTLSCTSRMWDIWIGFHCDQNQCWFYPPDWSVSLLPPCSCCWRPVSWSPFWWLSLFVSPFGVTSSEFPWM